MMKSGRRCAACMYLRRRCPSICIFAPYFPPNKPHKFSSVHRVFGASNVSKMLEQVPAHQRSEAVDTLYFEAQNRIRDPVYGCVPIISVLLNEIQTAEQMLAMTRAEITLCQHAVNLQAEAEFGNILRIKGAR